MLTLMAKRPEPRDGIAITGRDYLVVASLCKQPQDQHHPFSSPAVGPEDFKQLPLTVRSLVRVQLADQH